MHKFYQTLQESKATREKEIEGLIQENKSCLEDYNQLKKCLTILLNDDYLEMVVIRSEVLRDITNVYAHVKHEVLNEQIQQTIQHVQELFKRVKLTPEKENIDVLVKDLNDVLYREDDFYFTSGDSSVERLIDEHLLGELNKCDELVSYTDMCLLLERLDAL